METSDETRALEQIQQTSDTPVHTFDANLPPERKRAQAEAHIPKDFVPDLRSLGRHQDGFATEIGSSDADKIKQAIIEATQKSVSQNVTPNQTQSKRRQPQQPVVNTIAGYRVSHPLPDDSRIGWTAFSNATNPGGSLGIMATEKKKSDGTVDALYSTLMSPFDEHWQDYGVIFVIGVGFWLLVKAGGSMGSFILGLLFVASYYRLSLSRLDTRATDDMKRDLAFIALQTADYENVEWLNNFVQKFWLIFEPVLSAYVIENIDTYLVDYLPGFLDSVRLTTFTLGSKPFRVESVKSFTDTEPDTVCMDWDVSFVPNDTNGMTRDQIDRKVSPKVVLNIRLGKGFVGTALSVLVEDMSFKGRMRVKLQFISKMPHVKIVEACFMEKPQFDYVLKPLGGETFGFDVNNIPGLQGFVREQAHAILGPMLYYPNVFAYDVEKFFSGELDISQANGVLAVTVHSCSRINASDTTLNPFIRFFLNKAQELEKTAVLENTHTPQWNETKFLLLNNLDSILTMELRTTNSTKKAGKRLARSHFDLKDIKEEEDMELDNLTLPMQRHGKFITDLKVDMRYFPVSKPIQNPDGTYIEAAPSNSGVLRITIHECKNLGSNKINPYALLKINGVDRFETPTFKRTSNPKFERPFEILVLDMTQVYIRVSIIDRINFAGDASLGSWNAYLTDIMRDQEDKEYWWTLRKKGQEINARLRLSVQWKPVVMTGLAKMGGVGLYSAPVGVIRFSIWSAKNLVSTKSDLYVRIKNGKQTRARTEIIDSTDCPEWGEFHYVPIHSLQEDLVLEVMGWTSGSKDKSLGSTVFPLNQLIKQCKNENEAVWYESMADKLDRQVPLHTGNTQKGFLTYSAEFYPTMALAETDDDEDQAAPTQDLSIAVPDKPISEAKAVLPKKAELPAFDLHGLPIRYTPDQLIDLSCYGSGVLTVKIHEVKAPQVYDCYCQVMVDSLTPQHKTDTLKGRTLAFNVTTDAFIKDSGFSRVAIELKPPHKTEKDDDRLAYWYESSERLIRHIQQRAREKQLASSGKFDMSEMLLHAEEDEGEWYNLIAPVGGPAQIKLSFGYAPLLNYTVNPDESIENQGVLTVTLLNARKLKAVDKSGTSDPYVRFTINGDIVYKSAVVKKNCNPVWKNEVFEVPIISRVTASFRIEVFDWNQISGDVPLGSGGISIRGDTVESFSARDVDIPLDGQAGDTGTVRVRLKWEPQLLLRRKMHTTFMGTTRRMTTKMGTTAFNFSQPPKNTTSKSNSIQSKLSGLLDSTSSTSSTAKPLVDPIHEARETEQEPQHEQQKPVISNRSVQPSQPAEHNFLVKTSEGTVHIQVVEARNLKGDGDKINPVAIVHLGSKQLLKTKKIKKTPNPSWNETCSQKLSGEEIQLDIMVKDSHTFHSTDIGGFTFSLWDLIRPPIVTSLDKWLPLEPEGSGEVHIKIDYDVKA
ncbi:casein kinase 2 regulatory subunit [Mucor velutinosus]|uniref:Casein kinase 2 regulatory subunit n=1 Tax=Mucor velutinosus TaxID=708070 RepID=A0AAN7I3P0_9FUNG|nr:casein kinase 2 regulatory subunit [Mucor velutinosus]